MFVSKMSSEPTLLELLAVPSDNDFDKLSQTDPGPSEGPSCSAPSGNPPESKSSMKRKAAKADNAVNRDEFSAVQQQMSVMAGAMETLQNTIMASMAGQPGKRQKVDQVVSSSDESVATTKVIEDLLGPSDVDASTEALSAIEQLYSGEDSGEKIDEKLAAVITKTVRRQPSDDKMTEKLNSFKRPANIEELKPTRVNPEIWSSLQAKTRSFDIKLQKVESALLKSIVPIVSCIASLMKSEASDPKDLMTKLIDSVAIIGYSKYELNLRRRELIKPDLNRQFSVLCSAQAPVTGLLFGDNLTQQCKDIQENNKLGQKFGYRSNPMGHKN